MGLLEGRTAAQLFYPDTPAAFRAVQAFTDTSVSIEPRQEPTGLPLLTLQWVGRSIATVPKGFSLHPEVQRMLDARRRAHRPLICAASANMLGRHLCRQLQQLGSVHIAAPRQTPSMSAIEHTRAFLTRRYAAGPTGCCG